ncbi:hypothetical protein PVAP13_3KG123485 [Panicum virgatum]|uniref:Uncharacterized protein n=2 Tax=Panicum virgatum TaxID=38727 RepID=A0A8T0UYF9_PANVG|nr:hypothetical protein PVAP13_3KG123485 [Panicum virgatum]
MDKTLIIVCSVVGSLGALSAILGFSAEGAKLTPDKILIYRDECIYPQNPALGLGICAAIFLLAAQVTSAAVGGCCGCCKSRSIPSETKRVAGVVCAVVSWIAAAMAWVLLIVAASWNANVVREDAPFCPYLKDGIFAGGGVLSLAATALGIASYVMMRTQRVKAAAAPAKGEPPRLTPAAAQGGNGPDAPNVQESPTTQDPPADAPQQQAVAPSAPPLESAGDLPPAAMGQQLVLQQQQQPAAATPSQGDGLSTVVRNEVAKQGIRLAAKVVEHSLLS